MRRNVLLFSSILVGLATPASAITLTKHAREELKAQQLMSTAPADPNATKCKLQYGGGPLIEKVKVVLLFYGTNNNNQYKNYQTKLADFYAAITNSTYFDMLQEYNTNGYTIGRGSFLTTYSDAAPPTKT